MLHLISSSDFLADRLMICKVVFVVEQQASPILVYSVASETSECQEVLPCPAVQVCQNSDETVQRDWDFSRDYFFSQ